MILEMVELLIPSFQVGLAQIDIEYGDKDHNLATALDIIDQQSDLDILIFPELFLTGYDLTRKHELAVDLSAAPEIDELRQAAAKAKSVVIGTVITPWDKQFANTLFVINWDGQIVSEYKKAHLFRLMDEHHHFRPGKAFEVVTLSPKETQKETISLGLAICYDLRFPEMFRKLRLMGAEFFVIPAEWPAPRIDHWVALARARAIENQCYVLAVNRVGSDPNNLFGGKSLAVGPTGEILTFLEDEEVVGVVHVESFDLEAYQVKLPVIRDRRPDIYGI
ncbi:MAG: nitrilase-related carbon-nitrogen hydrolase [Candidatus Heimdallarchaeota archaeon]